MDEHALDAGSSMAGRAGRPADVAVRAADLLLGALTVTLSAAAEVGRPVSALAGPVAHVLLRPPLVTPWMQPGTWLDRVARRGAAQRHQVLVDVEETLDRLVPALVAEVLRHVDLTLLVRTHVDVLALAHEVIAGIDLPALVRESTSAVTSDTLLGVRMQSISADEAVGRAVERLRARLVGRPVPPSPLAVP